MAEVKHGTAIEWTHGQGYKGETWNPAVGCSKVSRGCRFCYAEQVHKMRHNGIHGYPEFRPWTALNAAHNVTMLPERLEIPLRWRKPRMVFVNSMSDMFHERLTLDFVAQVFAVMSIADQHVFQVLTKRPAVMRAVLTDPMFWLRVNAERMRRGVSVLPGGMSSCWPTGRKTLPNVWLGTTIEDRKWVGRADDLRATPAAVRFISAEPLLGPLDDLELGPRELPHPPLADDAGIDAVLAHERLHARRVQPGIDWLIVGGESGPKHRPIRAEWVRDLRDACAASGTAFFFKQWGGKTPKAGGRELDGRTWDEIPATTQDIEAARAPALAAVTTNDEETR